MSDFDIVSIVKMAQPPGPIPDGLKVLTIDNSQGSQINRQKQLALGVGSFTLWPMSYDDNRMSMNIVAYDPAGNIVAQAEKTGARYIYNIVLDKANETVAFIGQADQSITLSLQDIVGMIQGSGGAVS